MTVFVFSIMTLFKYNYRGIFAFLHKLSKLSKISKIGAHAISTNIFKQITKNIFENRLNSKHKNKK